MARYRKVDVRMWGDQKFQALSKLAPSGQALWIFLLTGPHTTIVPGLFRAGRAALAESVGWSADQFDAAWAEIEAQGMALADWNARVVWVPGAARYNPPESPNVAAAWRAALVGEIPECPLRDKAERALSEALMDVGEPYVAAWEHGLRPRSKIAIDVAAQVKKRDGSRCRYCGQRVDWSNRRGPSGATYDHVDPRGPAAPENVVVACRKCNSFKGLRTPSEAGMHLSESEPGPDLGSDLDSEPGPAKPTRRNQEQEQEQEQEEEAGYPTVKNRHLRRRPAAEG